MIRFKNNTVLLLMVLSAFSLTSLTACSGSSDNGKAKAASDGGEDHGDGDDHGAEEGGEHDEAGGVVEMDAAERKKQDVKTAILGQRALAEEVIVPGEVTLDLYRTAQITPRIPAQTMQRHVRLGDKVEEGQSLVTLSSVEMADAQGALIVTSREWTRVAKLGRGVVSERRFIEAQVAAQQARAKVEAYGMTETQIDAFAAKGDASKATGSFDLLAPQAGTIIRDDFIIGEVVEPGRVLFEISDESNAWVEARLTPEQAGHVEPGASARISLDGSDWREGRIIQIRHALDETTRTLSVRIEVDNSDDELHPGQFVSAAVNIGETTTVLAVPAEAIVLMDGSQTLFKVEGDELHPTPIETGVNRGGWVEVTGGVNEGEEIVVSQLFLLKSLILKSKMGSGHGH
jgi:membrane fusion protein, heavy metal efflux system